MEARDHRGLSRFSDVSRAVNLLRLPNLLLIRQIPSMVVKSLCKVLGTIIHEKSCYYVLSNGNTNSLLGDLDN